MDWCHVFLRRYWIDYAYTEYNYKHAKFKRVGEKGKKKNRLLPMQISMWTAVWWCTAVVKDKNLILDQTKK